MAVDHSCAHGIWARFSRMPDPSDTLRLNVGKVATLPQRGMQLRKKNFLLLLLRLSGSPRGNPSWEHGLLNRVTKFHLFCRALPTLCCKRPHNTGSLEEVHFESHCLDWITVQSCANCVARLLKPFQTSVYPVVKLNPIELAWSLERENTNTVLRKLSIGCN